MRNTLRSVILGAALAAIATSSSRAVIIQGELYNSFALLNSDNSTPLVGGDLVQIVLAGGNNADNGVNTFGGLNGDDSLLGATQVGVGIVGPADGFLDLYPMTYDSSLQGQFAFVRFWNGTTVAGSTYYGDSSLFTLPNGDIFNQSDPIDFAPTSTLNTSTAFSLSVVPEPSSLFLFGLFIFGAWTWKRRQALGLVTTAALLLAVNRNAAAQGLGSPQDVYNSVAIFNTTGGQLPGSNPLAASNGCTAIPGCLVQILSVGSNGVAHVANLDGTPGGGDTTILTTVIGQGISPCTNVSGQFSTSFYPPPASGTKIYARVFNAPTVGGATAWGQSATFTADGKTVMDLSVLGMQVTTMPLGVDLATVDAKGYAYYTELVANTNPQDPTDQFQSGGVLPGAGAGVQVSQKGHAGRQYTLQRTTNLAGTVSWADINTTAVLPADQTLTLSDPNPPTGSNAFYHVKITMP